MSADSGTTFMSHDSFKSSDFILTATIIQGYAHCLSICELAILYYFLQEDMDEHGIDWEEFVPPADTDVQMLLSHPFRAPSPMNSTPFCVIPLTHLACQIIGME